jgi:6-phosphogluconate dehydrogenase
VLRGPGVDPASLNLDRDQFLAALEDALLFAKISSYAQGMALLRAASVTYEYNLNLAEIARIWKGGCIIRAKLLDPIREAFGAQPDLASLLLAPHIAETVNATAAGARQAILVARQLGIPCPALSASLDYFDTFRAERLPANLVQAQRDYFGAHTYRRLDREGIFHTQWSSQEAP